MQSVVFCCSRTDRLKQYCICYIQCCLFRWCFNTNPGLVASTQLSLFILCLPVCPSIYLISLIFCNIKLPPLILIECLIVYLWIAWNSLYRQHWLWTCGNPASAFWVMILQACATMPGLPLNTPAVIFHTLCCDDNLIILQFQICICFVNFQIFVHF